MKTAIRQRLHGGSSLIEVMMAGLVLAIGMSGILLLLLRGVEENRDASYTVNAATLSVATLAQVTASNVKAVDAQVGTRAVRDPNTGRNFVQTITAIPINTIAVRARQVTVTTGWSSHIGNQSGNTVGVLPDGGLVGRVHTATTVVSELFSEDGLTYGMPDAGP